MQITDRLVRGIFLTRPNRFRVQVEIEGQERAAHLPDPGRLEELLLPGAELVLTRQDGAHRKTHFDVLLVRQGAEWVCVNTHLANRTVEEALRAGALAPFSDYAKVRREVPYGHSRLDFFLSDPARRDLWIEVKSVSLIVGEERALFPDAPTKRGTRHLEALIDIVAQGDRAAVLFAIQRQDARRFAPHAAMDPVFAETLQVAKAQGVEIHAYRSIVQPTEIRLDAPVEVEL